VTNACVTDNSDVVLKAMQPLVSRPTALPGLETYSLGLGPESRIDISWYDPQTQGPTIAAEVKSKVTVCKMILRTTRTTAVIFKLMSKQKQSTFSSLPILSGCQT